MPLFPEFSREISGSWEMPFRKANLYKYVNIAQTNWGKKRRAGQIGHTPEPSFIQGPHTPLIHHTHTL